MVTDVQMPVLDGIDLTRRVKSDEKTRKTPVLILSSLETPQDRRRGVEAGADGYLGKAELDAEKLSRMVERLCGTPT
jgi:two-component system chemotaxis sensor kinase CheA/two-component system sensor histidine kinase and response regulator WspE